MKTVKDIWLSGNAFHCDCEIIWMINWLNSVNDITGRSTVWDYRTVKCSSGKLEGVSIHKISDVLLGCYPLWSRGQIVGVSVSAIVVFCLFVVLATVAFKKSREVRFLVHYYLRLDTVPKDDEKENLENIEYDAFLCFW